MGLQHSIHVVPETFLNVYGLPGFNNDAIAAFKKAIEKTPDLREAMHHIIDIEFRQYRAQNESITAAKKAIIQDENYNN